jgi:hypothetical protein
VGLLERFVDGGVRYRATSQGRHLYGALSALLSDEPPTLPRSHELTPGDEIDLVAAFDRGGAAHHGKLSIKVRLEQ